MSKFSFGMIVFNGDFFLKQCLDGVYDFAHEIIVIEGADAVSRPFANALGQSTDNTWETLKNYPDPKNKIKLIRGTFAGKDEQSNEYMKHVTGDFIWLLDSDELYHSAHIDKLARTLHDDPELMAVEMRHHVFFGGLTRIAHGKHWENTFWRIHRFFPGCTYATHRPPTVMHPNGGSMNAMRHLSADQLDDWGIRMHHYSYVLDRQVEEKIRYHAHWRPTKYPKERDVNYFHYDYLTKIWEPWKTNRQAVESQHGISPNIYRSADGVPVPDSTVPFTGTHPAAMHSHWLYQQTFNSVVAA